MCKIALFLKLHTAKLHMSIWLPFVDTFCAHCQKNSPHLKKNPLPPVVAVLTYIRYVQMRQNFGDFLHDLRLCLKSNYFLQEWNSAKCRVDLGWRIIWEQCLGWLQNWNLIEILLKFVWNSYEIYLTLIWITFEIYLKFVWNLFEIHLKYIWNAWAGCRIEI